MGKIFKFNFEDCKSFEDIKFEIEFQLHFETIVTDEEDAKRHFKECEIKEDVETETIFSKNVHIVTEEGEEIYFVRVCCHFVPGYESVYSYSIALE